MFLVYTSQLNEYNMAKINACLEVEYKGNVISVVLVMLKLYLIVIILKH